MTARPRSALLFAMIAAVCAALVWSGGVARAEGRVPLPVIPKAQGERCVADTDFMRRNHMKLLSHSRDEAVHLGQRKADVALQRCLTCHAVNGADGKPVTYANPGHFCRTCHDYAAVSVDCFSCHASVPDAKAKSASGEPADKDAQTLLGYLRGKDR
jgi:[DsrC]-trisulfide reductase subunit J